MNPRHRPFHPAPAERYAAQARTVAREVYYLCGQIFRTHKPADRVLGSHFRRNRKFGSTDRRLIGDTFYAVFRWWGWLRQFHGVDAEFWERDPETVDAWMHWLNVLIAAQMLDTPDLPPIVLQWKDSNGIATYVKGAGDLSLPERAAEMATTFGIEGLEPSQLFPEWAGEMLQLPPERLAALVDCMQLRPPMWLRVQTPNRQALLHELLDAGLDVTPSPHLPNALRTSPTRVNLYELPVYREGLFEVQDFASQVIGATCAAGPGQRWWDVCAGAGGKAMQLSHAMQNKGSLLATDIRGYKLDELRRRARRAQFDNIRTKEWDGEKLPTKHLDFDGVLVDAPCSNTGTWRRNPDARWTTGAEEIAEMAALQRQILDRAAPAVKIGGTLVYATCSLCPAENEELVAAFLADHPNYAPAEVTHPVTQVVSEGCLRIWPDDADSDGMFVAKLIRRG